MSFKYMVISAFLFLTLRFISISVMLKTGHTAAVMWCQLSCCFLSLFQHTSLPTLSFSSPTRLIFSLSPHLGSPPLLHGKISPGRHKHTSKYEHACASSHLHNCSPYIQKRTVMRGVLISSAVNEEVSDRGKKGSENKGNVSCEENVCDVLREV